MIAFKLRFSDNSKDVLSYPCYECGYINLKGLIV